MLYLYQILIFLLGHLHYFLHFFFAFMENLFKKHPIPITACNADCTVQASYFAIYLALFLFIQSLILASYSRHPPPESSLFYYSFFLTYSFSLRYFGVTFHLVLFQLVEAQKKRKHLKVHLLLLDISQAYRSISSSSL